MSLPVFSVHAGPLGLLRAPRCHATGSSGACPVASSSAARAQTERAPGGGDAGSGGAVSRRKRSSAATIAAVCSDDGAGAMICGCGRWFTGLSGVRCAGVVVGLDLLGGEGGGVDRELVV
ncbi:MAG: hypothetical protein Q8O56_08990, partial [Solirubrobacteraceae bacterium]|nr:hypothetical protein [Solirubrobacteraceae bacterium]